MSNCLIYTPCFLIVAFSRRSKFVMNGPDTLDFDIKLLVVQDDLAPVALRRNRVLESAPGYMVFDVPLQRLVELKIVPRVTPLTSEHIMVVTIWSRMVRGCAKHSMINP